MKDLRRNIQDVFVDKEPFWGKYIELNNAIVPDIGMIQRYQLAKITEFQKIMSDKVKNKNQALNDLFLSGEINTLPSRYQKDGEEHLDRAISDIVGMLNGTYRSNITKSNAEYDYENLQKLLIALVNRLRLLNNVIQDNNGQLIPAAYINTLNEAIQACNIKSLDSNVLDEWFKHLNKFKGDLIEDIGVAWLSTLKIPNLQTLNTGALNYQGEGKYGRRGQLIQDLMTLEVSDADLDRVPIEYKDISGQLVKTNLRDFIAAMNNANAQHKQIILQDNGYETLLELSALNTQAKAGFNQLPWNESKSTSVSIGEFGDDGLTISTRHTFELLHSLDQDNIPQKDIWVKDSSKDYNLMADYGLATVLFKVLHLEENGNDYILTPQGFTTFTDRIAALIAKKHSRITIKEQVTINDNTLGTNYNVSMIGYKR